uniref:Helitron_like_N domain-containing protein n=1 Tax=Steinernema glaseri TaxID=37863 RepID=A0A1I8A2X9_9BILA
MLLWKAITETHLTCMDNLIFGLQHERDKIAQEGQILDKTPKEALKKASLFCATLLKNLYAYLTSPSAGNDMNVLLLSRPRYKVGEKQAVRQVLLGQEHCSSDYHRSRLRRARYVRTSKASRRAYIYPFSEFLGHQPVGTSSSVVFNHQTHEYKKHNGQLQASKRTPCPTRCCFYERYFALSILRHWVLDARIPKAQ